MSNNLPPEAKIIFYFKQGFDTKGIASKTGCSLEYVEDDIKAFVARIESLSDNGVDALGSIAPSCLIRVGKLSSTAAHRLKDAAIGRHARSKGRSAESRSNQAFCQN